MSKDEDTDDDPTETFSVVDLADYRRRKLSEEYEDMYYENEFNIEAYIQELREEELQRQRRLRANRVKDLIMLFYCLALTGILMAMLLN